MEEYQKLIELTPLETIVFEDSTEKRVSGPLGISKGIFSFLIT